MIHQLLVTYWEMGGRMAMENLSENAGYGRAIITRLARDMGTDITTLYRCIQFHETYSMVPKSDHLTWSHFRVLLSLKDPAERRRFAELAEKNRWTRDRLIEAIEDSHDETDNKGKKTKQLKRPEGADYVFKATVLDVVDGDSLVLDIDCGFDIKKKQRVRLAHVDAPPIESTDGIAAANYVRNQLAMAEFVVVKTTKVDIYGRYLADIFYSHNPKAEIGEVYRKGLYLNQELLDKGSAV
ncbi:MAG: thermonuclease family protein [Elusimicrobia bacterium]|nr:thermonuclease family protein [Elusimicrobiota bacterium]